MGSLSLLQGIFPTQESNPGLPHCRWILYQLSHKGKKSPSVDKMNDGKISGIKQLDNLKCWGWNSNILATSCEDLTHWKRLWCWEGLGAEGEGDDRGWDGWMASRLDAHEFGLTPGVGDGHGGVLWFMGSQRLGQDWATELNWMEDNKWVIKVCLCRPNRDLTF